MTISGLCLTLIVFTSAILRLARASARFVLVNFSANVVQNADDARDISYGSLNDIMRRLQSI